LRFVNFFGFRHSLIIAIIQSAGNRAGQGGG
jgi:hypothetical protein